jgi:hypothetical protein
MPVDGVCCAMKDLKRIESQFEELADKLLALIMLCGGEESASQSLLSAHKAAIRGAELIRGQLQHLDDARPHRPKDHTAPEKRHQGYS